MKFHLRILFLGSAGLLLSCTDSSSTAPPSNPASSEKIQPLTASVGLGVTPLAVDEHGVPHLLRGGDDMPRMTGASATEVARMHLARLSPAWGVRSARMPPLDALGEVAVRGGTIVRFRQMIDGMPVESTAGGELRVMVRPDGGLVGVSGKMLPSDMARSAPTFVDDEAGALARAVNDQYKTTIASSAFRRASGAAGDSPVMTGGTADVNVSMSRARKAWFPMDQSLVPAWIVEVYSSAGNATDGDAYRTVIASSGRIISRTNLKADSKFSYRVFAETAGEFHPFDGPTVDASPSKVTPVVTPPLRPFPNYVLPNLITVDGLNHPAGRATPDPWLPDDAIQTKGNNVDAYDDVNPPDGLSDGDFRADATTAPVGPPNAVTGAFDRTYDTAKDALSSPDQQKAGITSLFYLINWMHDFWYDGGFTEAAGNGQDSNYGRGGQEHDAVLAEAQDGAPKSRDNANMATPSDGFPGRMQVFVWDNDDHRKLTVGGVDFATGTAVFSPGTFDVTQPLALASDATAPAIDACEALDASASGKVVIADRGKCSFKTKALNAQNAHAAALVIADNVAARFPPGLGDDANIKDTIMIPVLSVTQADGVMIKAKVGADTTLHRAPDPDLDGALDITVVGHEYGHFVHHRLSVCNTLLCGAMSEGWADFSALLVSSRAGDDLDAQFPIGIYSTRGVSPDPVYYGTRRAPYTTNHAVNPLMFHHMAQGQALPPAPFNGDSTDFNNEVHNAGEVWASMLWEGYVALQKAGQTAGQTFEDVRLKMRQYVVAGLLMAPPDATPTETRDAILMAVKAVSQTDHDLLVAAYAKRGFGSCAVSPDRDSVDFTGIVDSSDIKGRFGPAEPALNSTACDNDDSLDPGESLQIQVPITNPGPIAMHGAKATLTTRLPAIHIDADKATVALGTIDAHATAMATFTVSLDSTLTQPTDSDMVVTLASDDGCGPVQIPVIRKLNTDDKPSSSATDTFDASGTPWTVSHVKQSATDNDELWFHVRATSLDGLWLGADLSATSDISLTSPPITAGSGALIIAFVHAFGFEAQNPGAPNQISFDGGVIEISTDDGATWQDVMAFADPGYNGTLDNDPRGTNVLKGRKAFTFINRSFPNGDTVRLNFGTKLAGKTFRLRFRIGTDEAGGGPGWLIDNFQVSGASNTPFPTVVADDGRCDGAPDDGGCCQAGGMGTGNIAAALGVLGLVLRRRRRHR